MPTIPEKLMQITILHFENGVPIKDTYLTQPQRERLARVEHVYWQWLKNPFLDAFALFKQLSKGKGSDVYSEWRIAKRDKILFDFVVEHIAPPSRRVSEARVRAAGNHLMEMGMQTDNGRDIEAGAKLIMKLDMLDQPEDHQTDISKVAFLPPVVTMKISDVDPTKQDISDKQSRSIMEKYGGYIDEKRTLVEEKVAAMNAMREQENEQVEEAEVLP